MAVPTEAMTLLKTMAGGAIALAVASIFVKSWQGRAVLLLCACAGWVLLVRH